MSYTVQHELKGHVSKPVPWWIVIAILVFAAFFIIVLALYIGHRVGYASAERPIVLTKACPAPEQFKPRWDCGATEARTYCSTCLRRRWL